MEKSNRYCKRPVPCHSECFIHRDYHPANVLWKNDTVSGIVTGLMRAEEQPELMSGIAESIWRYCTM
ncbi:phosphotransferase [Virgibacillus tibetensis]|uniref:phosphotransferase n=1 Tax=Virgibacillus tibetensis TaxID=3042313 RepID=UPI00389A6446